MLADWFDAKNPNDTDPEVQNDLRQWADDIDKLVIINDDIARSLSRIKYPEIVS